ncbi:MAG: HAD family hydrolase [Desulfobacterales bacterium]
MTAETPSPAVPARPKSGRGPSGLFLTDLDGTLLGPERTIAEDDRRALLALGDAGIVRAVATGRSIFSLRRLDLAALPVDYLIVSSGAGVLEHPSGRLLRAVSMEEGDVRRAFRALRELGFDFMIHEPIPETHRFRYVALTGNNPDFTARIELYRDVAQPAAEHDSEAPGRATQLVAILPPGRAAEGVEAVRRALPGLTVIRTTSPLDGRSTWIEILPPGVSKASGAAWLAERLGIPHRLTAAVGNDFNDLELLSWAETAFVTGNAPEELRRRFTPVPANSRGGVGEAIRRWLPRLRGEEERL